MPKQPINPAYSDHYGPFKELPRQLPFLVELIWGALIRAGFSLPNYLRGLPKK